MIKELAEYKNLLGDFIKYLKGQQVNIDTFFKLDFKFRVGFYIEFLGIRNITICYDAFNYAVYYDNDGIEATKHYKKYKSVLIAESNNTNITNVLFPIENFKLGLIEAFKHLENPF